MNPSDTSKDEGGKVPKTATTIFKWMMIGLALIGAGGLLFILKRKNEKA